MQKVFICSILLSTSLTCLLGRDCSPRDYNQGGIVCVCNATYCDYMGALPKLTGRNVHLYESNKAGERFKRSLLSFKISGNKPSAFNGVTITIDKSKKYQTIVGFGGAFTDAAGINMKSLPTYMTEDILRSYFSEEGLSYNMARVPIASCDFSTYKYSYDDVPGDFELRHFQLAHEDFTYKIPLIHKAHAFVSDPLLLLGSPWSCPSWMKTNEDMAGVGVLKGEPGGPYYKTWANYFVKFLQAYESHNLTFWGLTAQNEPALSLTGILKFQSLGFTSELQKRFIKLDLGPALKASGYGTDKIKLMIVDDLRNQLPKMSNAILSDPEAAQYISGVAVHWYLDHKIGPEVLDEAHEAYPDKFILYTEACNMENNVVLLGNWTRGELYAQNILEDLLHWSVGWVDWNMVLDLQGGPNWVNNFVDAPIIVNKDDREFYKQPMYYTLGHFSKFLKRGSVRIGIKVEGGNGIDAGAFSTPDGGTVVIVLNRDSVPYEILISELNSGIVSSKISPNAIQSYIW